jgi:hypothetical protein
VPFEYGAFGLGEYRDVDLELEDYKGYRDLELGEL